MLLEHACLNIMRRMSKSWFILASTWHAGTKWFAGNLVEHTDIVIRHNITPLNDGGCLFSRTVPENYLESDDEGMRLNRARYPYADYFEFLERYFDVPSYGLTDFTTASAYKRNLAIFPEQEVMLIKNNFKIANIVMNPIKLIEITKRYFIHYDPNPAVDFSQNEYKALKKTHNVSGEGELFLKSLLYQAENLRTDLLVADEMSMQIFTMEQMLTDQSYFEYMVDYLTSGSIILSKESLDKIFSNDYLVQYRSTPYPAPFKTARDPINEPRFIFNSLKQWEKTTLGLVFSEYGIFDLFQKIGYDFSYIDTSL